MKELIKQKLCHMPDFIQTTNTLHYVLWNKISECNDILYNLVTGPLYTSTSIYMVTNKYNNTLDDILLNLDTGYVIQLVDYFDNNMKFLTKIMIEEEMYEGMANIRDFNKILQDLN